MTAAPESEFYSADPVSQIAINLFYGWGYNFYRVENQLRADDLLVRHEVAGLLGESRAAIGAAESAYRAAHLPPLSREHPRPDPDALAGARILEALAAQVGAAASRIRSLPVPENDRVWQRHRAEADTLARLLHADMALAGTAEELRRLLKGQPPDWIVANADGLRAKVAAVDDELGKRQALLGL